LKCDAQSLEAGERAAAEEREREGRTLSAKLKKCKDHVRDLELYMTAMGSADDSVEALQDMMSKVHTTIATFKANAREKYSQLMMEERILDNEVAEMMERIQEWEDDQAIDGPHTHPHTQSNRNEGVSREPKKRTVYPRHTAVDDSQTRPVELDIIINQIERDGGRYGNWDERDHAQFLRILARFGLPTAVQEEGIKCVEDVPNQKLEMFFQTAVAEIVTQTAQSIAFHLRWHFQYLTRLDEKKKIVAEWRYRKSIEQDKKSRDKMELEKENIEVTQVIEKRLTAAARAEQDAKKALLSKWREDKERKAREDLQAKIKLDQEKELERQHRIRMELEEKKRLVAEFKKRREEDREMSQRALELKMTSNKPVVKTQDFDKFRERDMQMLRAKKEKMDMKAAPLAEKEERLRRVLSKKTLSIPKDPSRLLQQTNSSKAAAVTTAELEQREAFRVHAGAHSSVVASASGASIARGRGFGIGTSFASSRAVPSWRTAI
jgi:hypothetical protein